MTPCPSLFFAPFQTQHPPVVTVTRFIKSSMVKSFIKTAYFTWGFLGSTIFKVLVALLVALRTGIECDAMRGCASLRS
jgi:hypothetical protein